MFWAQRMLARLSYYAAKTSQCHSGHAYALACIESHPLLDFANVVFDMLLAAQKTDGLYIARFATRFAVKQLLI